MTADWVVPTARAITWWPVAGAASVSVAIGTLLHAGDGRSGTSAVGVLLLGATASTASLAVDDPGHALLAAVPTPVWRRRLRAVALLGPLVVAAGWLAARSLPSTPGLASLVALSMAALAVAAAVAVRRPEVAAVAGSAAAIAWAVAAAVIERGPIGEVARLWVERPGAVAAVAAVALAWSACR